MSHKAKWENFSKEELEYIFKTSLTKAEILKRIGYKKIDNIKPIQDILNKYDFDISHLLGSGNRTSIPMIGKTFYRLTVLEEDINYTKSHNLKDRNKYYKCQCSCDNKTIITVSGHNLRNGSTKSCGCLIKDLNKQNVIPMIGKKFGLLTVLSIDNDYKIENNIKSSSYFYKCRCDCGKIITVNGTNLRRKEHSQKSCGCITSKGEQIIKELLTLLKINFKQQCIFDDLKSNKGYNLKFDFGILNKQKSLVCLIEFQGEQHYKIIPGWIDEDKFLVQQENDKLKRKYCQLHHIPLIEIPYWDLKKIDENYIKEKILCLL